MLPSELGFPINFNNNSTNINGSQTQNNANAVAAAAALAAAAAASQMNPFYIDKLFNFQNMFLLSGAAAASANGAQNSNQDPSLAQYPALNNNKLMPKPHDELLAKTSLLMQQNLLHNVYNYYSPSAFHNANLNSSSKSKPNQSTNGSPKNNNELSISVTKLANTGFNTSTPNENSARLAKNNFSIERILSLPTAADFGHKKQPAESYNYPTAQTSDQNGAKQHFRHQMGSVKSNGNYQALVQNAKLNHRFTPMAITAPIPAAMASMVSTPASAFQNLATGSKLGQFKTKHMGAFKNGAQLNNDKSKDQQPVVKSKNAKKYKCDLCGRGFSRSNTLITHRVSFFFFLKFED